MIVVDPGVEGLGAMLAELVRSNVERDPRCRALLRAPARSVNVRAPDAGVEVGIILGGGQFRVLPAAHARADLEVVTDSDTLMSLSSTPLRFGLPDLMTTEGRAVTKKMLTGELKVRGIVPNLGTLIRLQKLLSVAP